MSPRHTKSVWEVQSRDAVVQHHVHVDAVVQEGVHVYVHVDADAHVDAVVHHDVHVDVQPPVLNSFH